MEFPEIPISEESIFPLGSLSLTLGGAEEFHNISAPSSIPRDNVVKRNSVSRHNTSKRNGDFNLTDLKLHTRNVGAHGPRLLQYYGGNTLEAQLHTVENIEKYRMLHSQSPITPIGNQGPRGGESQLHWKCNICGREFDTFQKVAVHLTSREWGLANWKCLEIPCDRVYQSRNELIRHKNTSHRHARPDEYTDASNSPGTESSPSSHHQTGPLHSSAYLSEASPAVFPHPPTSWIYDQHNTASSTIPHSQRGSFEHWSSPHVETFHRFVRNPSLGRVKDAAVLPPTRGPVGYQESLESAPHTTQTADSNGHWLPAGYGLNRVSGVSSYSVDTSALFRMPSTFSDGNLGPYSDTRWPITPFHPQSRPVDIQGQYQPFSQSFHPPLPPTSSTPYVMNPLPRNLTNDVEYNQGDRPLQQPHTRGDTRKYSSSVGSWLHHDSELKAVALYQLADATARQAPSPANTPIRDRFIRPPSTTNGRNCVREKSYGHQMDTT